MECGLWLLKDGIASLMTSLPYQALLHPISALRSPGISKPRVGNLMYWERACPAAAAHLTSTFASEKNLCVITNINIPLRPEIFFLSHFSNLNIDALGKNIISVLLVVAQMVIASKWKNRNPPPLKNWFEKLFVSEKLPNNLKQAEKSHIAL